MPLIEVEINLTESEAELLGTHKAKVEEALAMLAEVALAELPVQLLLPRQDELKRGQDRLTPPSSPGS